MEITIITSEYYEGTYFDDELEDWGKSDFPAAESIFAILKKIIQRGIMPSGIHVYYLDDIPVPWRRQFPKSLGEAKAAFQRSGEVAAKLAEAEALTGMKLAVIGPSFTVYNELHWPCTVK